MHRFLAQSSSSSNPHRITVARNAFDRMAKSLWTCRKIIKTNIREYNIADLALYDCKKWLMRVENIKKLPAFDHS